MPMSDEEIRERNREYARKRRAAGLVSTPTRWHLMSVEDKRAARKRWRERNPGWKTAHRYGLTVEQVNEMLAGGCEICGSTQKLCLDHDHDTGQLRGCLCNACNSLIDRRHDGKPRDPEWLARATAYLERTQA